jgi:hypothetical protein
MPKKGGKKGGDGKNPEQGLYQTPEGRAQLKEKYTGKFRVRTRRHCRLIDRRTGDARKGSEKY